MLFRLVTFFIGAWTILALPLLGLDADDSRPACSPQNQGRMWPEAANHDSKLLSRLVRCGELLICVRGSWRYHWETPSVRLDQLGRGAKSKTSKPSVCGVQAAASDPPQPDPAPSNDKLE
jgi:hypothetical protein